jgi:DNA-binding transcriptional MerR regulator
MTLPELLDKTGVSARTLRHWTQHGLMPHPDFGAGGAGYTHEHVVRIFAIYQLQENGVRQLAQIAARLDTMTPEQMQQLAGVASPAPVVAPLPEAVGTLPGAVGTLPGAVATPATPVGEETWTHLTLRDGLVLLVRTPASEETRVLVDAIAVACGRTPVGS